MVHKITSKIININIIFLIVALFCFNSVKSFTINEKKMIVYEFSDKKSIDSVIIHEKEAIDLKKSKFNVKLIHFDKNNPKQNLVIEEIVEDIDPEGKNSMDMFDPSGDFSPGKVFMKEGKDFKISIFIPYDSDANYIGIDLEYRKNEINIKSYEKMLILKK